MCACEIKDCIACCVCVYVQVEPSIFTLPTDGDIHISLPVTATIADLHITTSTTTSPAAQATALHAVISLAAKQPIELNQLHLTGLTLSPELQAVLATVVDRWPARSLVAATQMLWSGRPLTFTLMPQFSTLELVGVCSSAADAGAAVPIGPAGSPASATAAADDDVAAAAATGLPAAARGVPVGSWSIPLLCLLPLEVVANWSKDCELTVVLWDCVLVFDIATQELVRDIACTHCIGIPLKAAPEVPRIRACCSRYMQGGVCALRDPCRRTHSSRTLSSRKIARAHL